MAESEGTVTLLRQELFEANRQVRACAAKFVPTTSQTDGRADEREAGEHNSQANTTLQASLQPVLDATHNDSQANTTLQESLRFAKTVNTYLQTFQHVLDATPTSQTDDPASQTDDPVSQTDDPASQTDDPASQTDDPASQTDDPAGQTNDRADDLPHTVIINVNDRSPEDLQAQAS